MHHESHDLVIVVEVRGSKFDISIINNWVDVAIFVQDQVSLEVNIEVLEDELLVGSSLLEHLKT